MAKVIIMPKLGFTQDEGSLVAWHKQIGESVKKGEPFFDVHTDKSVVTIDAAENGTLLKIVVEPETFAFIVSVLLFMRSGLALG